MTSDTLQPLHTRPLQSFTIVEDLTTALHHEILRIYQNCVTMWVDTICEDEAAAFSMREMDDAVKEYESSIPYHACGQRGVKIWAGTGDRVKQAALWSQVKDKTPHPEHPRAQYSRVVAQLHEEVFWCDNCAVAELKMGGTLLSTVLSLGSLAEELAALRLDEDDGKRVESWRRGKVLGKLQRLSTHLQPLLLLSKENSGSSSGTAVGNNDLVQCSEPPEPYDVDSGDENGALLRNEHGCYQNSDGICCCPCPSVVYL